MFFVPTLLFTSVQDNLFSTSLFSRAMTLVNNSAYYPTSYYGADISKDYTTFTPL